VYALIFYSSGIWVFSGLRVVRAVFYSMQDTKTPLKVALLTVVINAFFCYFLKGPLQHGGLALALVIAASVNFFVLLAILRSKLGSIDGTRIAATLLKVSTASFIMGCAGWFMLQGDMWMESGRTLEKSLLLTGVIAVCVGLYLLFMYLMKSDELSYLLKMRKKS
jgi:putative peptidoglycan lipid II flippase